MEDETQNFLMKPLGELTGKETLELTALTAVVAIVAPIAVGMVYGGILKTSDYVKGRIKLRKAQKTIKELNEVA